jgi:proline iminopeptidase
VYPAIYPYDQGHLDVGDGTRVYWEQCGNPAGKPVVVLHGGPGSGCSSGMRRYFDPHAYRIVLFDQRGCGRSTPHASDPSVDLATNTTEHLLADIERLRGHLHIERWMVFGVSWGSTLGLAYAERHPERIVGMVLAGVTAGRRSEIDWVYRDVAPLFPEEWSRFREGAAAAKRDGDLVAAYHRLLEDPDPAVRGDAARRWTDWDWATASVQDQPELPPRWTDPSFQVARARICTHYFTNNLWLKHDVLMRDIAVLASVPAVLINGRLDLQCPLATAWELHQAWAGSQLVIVSGAGHSAADPGMGDAIVAATDRMASEG